MNIVKKRIAIIIVNYNGLGDSIQCIKSIRMCDSYSQVKIVFVDNASKVDETIRINELFPDVHTIRSKINGGFSYGNNLGIKWALDNGYDYVMLLNNDTVISKDLIENLFKQSDVNSIVVPKILYYSQKDLIWYGGGNINKKTGNAETWNLNKIDSKDNNIKTCSFASGCCMLISTSIFQQIGLLDENFFMYCEDMDFCVKLQLYGFRIKYVPTAKLWHKVSASTGGNKSAFNIYYLTRNRIEIIKKYKGYFSPTALPYTILSRKIRRNQMKKNGNSAWKAFDKGIKDGLKGVKGKVDLSEI